MTIVEWGPNGDIWSTVVRTGKSREMRNIAGPDGEEYAFHVVDKSQNPNFNRGIVVYAHNDYYLQHRSYEGDLSAVTGTSKTETVFGHEMTITVS